MSRIIVVYNPESGDRKGKDFLDSHVLPMLESAGCSVDKVLPTPGPGNQTAKLLLEYLRPSFSDVSVVLASGDGTLSEIISGLAMAIQLESGDSKSTNNFRLHFALVPIGTANALYSSFFPPSGTSVDPTDYKLLSIQSLINAKTASPKTRPLTLGVTTLSSQPSSQSGKKAPQVAISCVVVSAALHAYILHDSEEFRQEHPGVERFKMAAQKNSNRWAMALVKLFPTATGHVELYDPATKEFIDASEVEGEDSDIVDIGGPFAYFVSTVNVDRLEPTFRVTPLQSSIPSQSSCDLVMVRPDRDPTFTCDTDSSRAAFVEKIWKVMGEAYQDGEHVNLRYAQDGSIVKDGDGPTVVEYYRCSAWEWLPDVADEKAHMICVDGAIMKIEPNGRAFFSTVTPDSKGSGFSVYI